MQADVQQGKYNVDYLIVLSNEAFPHLLAGKYLPSTN